MDSKIDALRTRRAQATIDNLNQYLQDNIGADDLVDSLQDMIKFLNQFIFENKTDNFDLKKYLAEGKLFEEDYKNDYANSEEDFTDEMVVEKIKDIIKYHELDPSDVMEEVGQEFGIAFEFGRG